MKIDPGQHTEADNYKLLTNLVVPRPIAWVTSINESGLVNLAPFSFFNAVSSDPLQLVVSVGVKNDDSKKDTAANINQVGEFVVNMVTEELMNAMNISAADFPSNISELNAAGLNAVSCEKVKVPRVAESPVSFECTLRAQLPVGSNTLFVGEVVMMHVTNNLIGPRLHINGFAPIGRLGSPSMYCRTTDRFDLPRISYDDYLAQLEHSSDVSAFTERAYEPVINYQTLVDQLNPKRK